MLVRFLKSGPVKFGPGTIHGFPAQIADMEGDDLTAALESGAVEVIEPAQSSPAPRDPLDHDGDGRKGGSRKRKAV